jgi:TRAP-type C4-dicarboxylate transport system substrate-binding protein
MQRLEVTTLPFESPGIIESSAAAWNMYKAGVFAEDLRLIRIISMWCFPPSGLHTTKEVRKLEDLKGMKLTSATRSNGDIIERLGATVVSITNPEVYGAIQRNVAQGLMIPDSGIVTFHLQEVTKYHINLALGCTIGAFLMNKEFYARQPADIRAALDAASGDAFAKHMSHAALAEDQTAHQKIHAHPGSVLVKLDEAEIARWHERLKPITEEWVAKTPDGAKVLGIYRAEIAKAKARS